jgi:hypothetical protein
MPTERLREPKHPGVIEPALTEFVNEQEQFEAVRVVPK